MVLTPVITENVEIPVELTLPVNEPENLEDVVPDTSNFDVGIVEPIPTLLLDETNTFASFPSREIYSALDIFLNVYRYL